MAEVAKIDDRRRMKVPKGTAKTASSVVIIDAGAYFLGIPIPRDPVQVSGSWLKTKDDVAALKRTAEAEVLKDAVSRAKRRRQLPQ